MSAPLLLADIPVGVMLVYLVLFLFAVEAHRYGTFAPRYHWKDLNHA